MSRPTATLHPVTVHVTKDASGDYKFDPESDIWDEARDELVFSKDRHGMHSHDHHLVEFVLDDRTGDGLMFPSSPHDAMWVARGHEERGRRTCPDQHTESDYSVMEPVSVSPDRKRLFVRNDNHGKEHWVFTMNFTKRGEDTDKSRFVSWDPGANNQNGGARR
jgi:hypothetical protein